MRTILLTLAPVMGALTACGQVLPSPIQPTSLVEKSTDYNWPLKTLDGKDFNLSSVKKTKKKILFVNIWATWCGPCRREMPGLQKLFNKFSKQITFVFVSQEEASVVENFMKEHNYTLPTYLTTEKNIPAVFKTDAIPTTFIVAPHGSIVFKEVGAMNWDSPEAVKILRNLFPTLK